MELINTRNAIHDAFAIGWSRRDVNMIEYMLYQTRIENETIPDTGEIICDLLEAGYIMAAVNKQKPHIASWLKYAYGNENRPADHIQVSSKIFMDLFHGNLRDKAITRHQMLCKIAVEDYRQRIWNGQALTAEFYSQAMKVWSNHFSRDWSHKRNNCLDEIGRYDKEGIGNVSMMVKSLRGHSELSPSEVLAEFGGENYQLFV